MQQKSDNYVEGNGIGPPSGYNNVDHQLQNQRKFMNRLRLLLNQFIFFSCAKTDYIHDQARFSHFSSVSSNNHRYISSGAGGQTTLASAERYNHLANDTGIDGMSSNILSHGGILPPETTLAGAGIDIFGFTSGSPLPPPSPAPPTTHNTQYSLLGGTTPSTVILIIYEIYFKRQILLDAN